MFHCPNIPIRREGCTKKGGKVYMVCNQRPRSLLSLSTSTTNLLIRWSWLALYPSIAFYQSRDISQLSFHVLHIFKKQQRHNDTVTKQWSWLSPNPLNSILILKQPIQTLSNIYQRLWITPRMNLYPCPPQHVGHVSSSALVVPLSWEIPAWEELARRSIPLAAYKTCVCITCDQFICPHHHHTHTHAHSPSKHPHSTCASCSQIARDIVPAVTVPSLVHVVPSSILWMDASAIFGWLRV